MCYFFIHHAPWQDDIRQHILPLWIKSARKIAAAICRGRKEKIPNLSVVRLRGKKNVQNLQRLCYENFAQSIACQGNFEHGHHNTLFSQTLSLIPRHVFQKLENRHKTGRSSRRLGFKEQFTLSIQQLRQLIQLNLFGAISLEELLNPRRRKRENPLDLSLLSLVA